MSLAILDEGPDGWASFSPCRRYRYALGRRFGDLYRHGTALVCGLNPSKAGAYDPDQTIRKEVGFAKLWGCDSLIKINLFDLIETYSKNLAPTELVGPGRAEAFELVRKRLSQASRVVTVVAWGSHSLVTDEAIAAVADMLPKPWRCLGTTRDGSPRHPSRLAYQTPLVDWRAA